MSVIHPNAHRIAHEFVAEFWHELPGDYRDNRKASVFDLETWLVLMADPARTTGLSAFALVNYARARAVNWYRNVYAQAGDTPADRVVYVEALSFALLRLVSVDKAVFQAHQTWFDLVGAGTYRAVYMDERLELDPP